MALCAVWVRKLSMVCLPNNAFVASCILVTLLHCGTPKCTSAPTILLVLLEPYCNLDNFAPFKRGINVIEIAIQ